MQSKHVALLIGVIVGIFIARANVLGLGGKR